MRHSEPRPHDSVGLPPRVDGVITGVNAHGDFRIKLVNGRLVHGRMSDELHRWFVRLLPGDKVEVDLDSSPSAAACQGVIVDRRLPDGRSLLAALRQTPPFPPGSD